MTDVVVTSALLSAGFVFAFAGGAAKAQPADPPIETGTVHSIDGTRIGYTRVGSGPVPLVLVHGALNTGRNWMPVATALSEHCTCYVVDRWGRGGSEHRSEYAFDREAEDILAVLEAAGPDALLLGHSSGAVYALEAALRRPLRGLILYEPPLHAGPLFVSILERIQAAAEEGRFDEAVTIFLRDEARLPEDEIAFLRDSPIWEQMVALAPHSVQEWVAMTAVDPSVERYEDLQVPTLLLAGTMTKEHPSFATESLAKIFADVRIERLDGQGHTGHLGDPDQVAEAVAGFLLKTYD